MVDLLSGLARRVWILLLATLVVAAACAHGGSRADEVEDRPREMGPRADESEEPTSEEVTVEPAPREIDRDRGIAIDTGAGTPQRRASLRVVEEGRSDLLSGRTREAALQFQRALQMDPTNGFAYYWLGRARVSAGDARGAIGVLQKAESLLRPYPEWREQATDLLASLGAR